MNICGIRLLLFFVISFPSFLLPFGDLSVVNESNWTLLVHYRRPQNQGRLLTKLVEPGEALNFGTLTEAVISGYGALWRMIAPKPYTVFVQALPVLSLAGQEPMTVLVKGVVQRALKSPFGAWDIAFVKGKDAYQVKPYDALVKQDSFVGIFPTVDRTMVLTPRFMLGLPNQAIRKADAIEAENMLSDKWLKVKEVNPEKVLSILSLLSKARTAYSKGLENVPMTVPVKLREQLGLMRQPDLLQP